jgi:hypothetical protein
MLDADARRIADAIQERSGGAVTATVGSNSTTPEGRPLPGGAQPTIVRYWIDVDDGTRRARLELGDANAVLDELTEGCDADRVFAAVTARGIAVEDEDRSEGGFTPLPNRGAAVSNELIDRLREEEAE